MRIRAALVVSAAVVAVGLGVGLGVGLTGPATTTSTTTTQSQLSSIQGACQQWLAGTPGQPGTGQWCTQMAQWMNRSMNRYGYGPQMMWGDPTSLAQMCDEWMGQAPPQGAPANPGEWCDAMTSWMTAHMAAWSGEGSWGGWMQYGPMRGFGAPASGSASTGPSSAGPGAPASGSAPFEMSPGDMMGR